MAGRYGRRYDHWDEPRTHIPQPPVRSYLHDIPIHSSDLAAKLADELAAGMEASDRDDVVRQMAPSFGAWQRLPYPEELNRATDTLASVVPPAIAEAIRSYAIQCRRDLRSHLEQRITAEVREIRAREAVDA